MRNKMFAWMIAIVFVGFIPEDVFANDALLSVYASRGDLQNAFDDDGLPRDGSSAAGFLMNLEDWARQYGWREYLVLSSYAPTVPPPSSVDAIVTAPEVTAPQFIVVDDASGVILTAQGAERSWPIASITKLMTGTVAIEQGIDLGGYGNVLAKDDVGGAKLYVEDGTTFTMRDLFGAMLVGSANNAANAIARLTGMGQEAFVDAMNAHAASIGLSRTTFVDPTGIELGNSSTAREVAHFAEKAFAKENIKMFVGASKVHIAARNDETYVRDIKNTNWLLYDPAYDDLYVTAGKTGFLHESGWNLVVRMHPMGETEAERSLVIVVLGSSGRRESFDDAASLARWAWTNFDWE